MGYLADGACTLILEFCAGGELTQRISKARQNCKNAGLQYNLPQAFPWLAEIFLGMEHVHLKVEGLLRDIKPENVVISKEGHAKLTDFGFAKLRPIAYVKGGLHSFGCPAGTPEYVAPELLREESYGWSVDIYSFGVLVWVVLAGGMVHSVGPPCAPWSGGIDPESLEVLCGNWNEVKRCVEDPQGSGALPLIDDVSKSFVLRLTFRGEGWKDQLVTHT